jgi:hypothetical protein
LYAVTYAKKMQVTRALIAFISSADYNATTPIYPEASCTAVQTCCGRAAAAAVAAAAVAAPARHTLHIMLQYQLIYLCAGNNTC